MVWTGLSSVLGDHLHQDVSGLIRRSWHVAVRIFVMGGGSSLSVDFQPHATAVGSYALMRWMATLPLVVHRALDNPLTNRHGGGLVGRRRCLVAAWVWKEPPGRRWRLSSGIDRGRASRKAERQDGGEDVAHEIAPFREVTYHRHETGKRKRKCRPAFPGRVWLAIALGIEESPASRGHRKISMKRIIALAPGSIPRARRGPPIGARSPCFGGRF